MKKYILFLFVFVLAVSVHSGATVLNVPAQYPTISSALSSATNGDTVLVQPGTYMSNIAWPAVNGIKLLSAGDSSNTFIDGGGAGRVLSFTSSAIDTNTIIRGFTIRNGQNGSYPTGAGVCLNNASPKFLGCNITGNFGNGTRSYGAGVAIVGSSSPVFRNSSVSNNSNLSGSYNFGAGIYMTSSGTLTMEGCKLEGNLSSGANYHYGVAIYVSGGTINLTDVRILKNISDGTTYNHGTGIYLASGATANLDRVYITDNDKTNSSRSHGGGIYCNASTLNATNMLIARNSLASNSSFYSGGGIYYTDGSGTLMNVTIADNYKTGGGSVGGLGIFLTGTNNVTITNSILWNTAGGAELSGTGVTITYSDINGGYAGTGNINSDPLFVSPTDYHLTIGSPCEGTGTSAGAPSYDIEDNPRPTPSGSSPDMGAYESGCQGVVSTAPTHVSSTTGGSICPGKSSTLTQEGGVLATGAQWYWYTNYCGGTLVDSGASITVSPTATTTYYVRAEGECNTKCVPITLNTSGTPITPIIYGPLSLCGGQSTTLSIVNNPCVGGGCSYFWSNGDTGLIITVSPSVTTIYTAYVTTGCGDTAKANYTVTVVPSKPTISVSGNVLTCSNTSAAGYQWFESGNTIGGANAFQYTVTQDGCYAVRITDGNGCVSMSDSVCVIFTGVLSKVQSSKFKVYPNPAGEKLVIQSSEFGEKTKLEIYNVLGERVFHHQIINQTSHIDVSGLFKGIYFIKLSDNDSQSIQKIVIQ